MARTLGESHIISASLTWCTHSDTRSTTFANIFLPCGFLTDSANFTPFAQRTQQMIKEQLGQAEDKTQLPDEYIELEKRVDALKLVHQKLLQVT